MELQLIRENMETEQILSAKPTQAAVETEVALPGGLREEARVYYADASVTVNGGEMTGSRVSADGRVTFHVLYAQGDLAHVKALETTADFSQSLPLKEENAAVAAVRLTPRAEVQHVSAKAFNGRLLLRAIMLLTAEAALPRTLSFVKDVTGDDGIQRSVQTLQTQHTVGEGEGQTLLREEFELSDVLQIKNTLYATAQAQVEDILGGGDGKATVTGTIAIEAYHTSDMPGRPLVYTRHLMPFEQTVALSGALGDALAAHSAVRDVAVLSQEIEGGGRIMRAEIQLYSALTAVENAEMNVLRDVFTTDGPAIDAVSQQVVFRNGTVNAQAAESGRAVMLLPEGSPRVKTALLGFVRPVLVKAEQQNGKLTADGILAAALIYLTDDSDVPVSVEQEIPFHTVFALDASPDDALSLTAVQVEPAPITGDRVELKYILRLFAEGVRKGEARVITDAEAVDAPAARQGIVLSFVQPGESLWDIAKRYRVSMDEIRHLNPQVEDGMQAGTPVITYKR
ncbi:MAG: LysM peptidoglycan-binding domain-containing protein [Clostridia bacterium]|nr:LysM peptidoglycan-binding domain-containing protein [Clostridia bacterium]